MNADQVQVIEGVSRIDVLEHSPENVLLTETEVISVLETAPAQGVAGPTGKSAYLLALDQGFVGTLDQWLESLKGKDAYLVALDNGYLGTYEQWSADMTPQAIAESDAFKILTNDGIKTFWANITVEQLATKEFVTTAVSNLAEQVVMKATLQQDVETIVNAMTLDVGSF